MKNRLLCFCLLFLNLLVAEEIATFHGTLSVDEPVLLELIHSPAIERLKGVRQYGISYYCSFPDEYTRYDHSLGVFAILRLKGAPLKEQIAGLLHDVSHTAFSHVSDWLFCDDYHTLVFADYLIDSGIAEILERHGYDPHEIHPDFPGFTRLEQPLPDLCADRIDYNIQGAYHQHFLTKEECKELVDSLVYEEGRWIMRRSDLAEKLGLFSLYMTEHCWGSAQNHLISQWLAGALLYALDARLLSLDEIRFGKDQEIWDKLHASQDESLLHFLDKLARPKQYFRVVTEAESSERIKFRCRGIDPWVEDGTVRLSDLVPEYKKALNALKERASIGWLVQMQ
ncbi:MAG: HD domain-containing protein [Verrucomicrobia bacterium]|nr:HD domain-containing protein [Verrucomicrobiota bacterium]